ncbi:hypothetical protein JTB14_007079 [Gonioctena quinquepunctata]|nr:hypothetical protein JTB14_007079 [Gonioctena quinquepunctata]
MERHDMTASVDLDDVEYIPILEVTEEIVSSEGVDSSKKKVLVRGDQYAKGFPKVLNEMINGRNNYIIDDFIKPNVELYDILEVTDRILPNPETEQSLSVPHITENPEDRTLTPNLTIGIAENDDITVRECNVRARTLTPSTYTVQNMISSSSPSILSNNAKKPVASTSTALSPLATTMCSLPELLTV